MHNKEEMICVDCLQIRLNRFILLAIGLWPYQQSKLTKLYLILCVGIMATFIVLQLLMILKCSVDALINLFSSILMYILFSIKLVAFIVNNKPVKYMLEKVQHLYNELTDKNEISIIKRYGSYAKLYTITLTCKAIILISHKLHVTFFKRSSAISIIGILVIFFYSFWPNIFDIVFIGNGTRSRLTIPFSIVYFVDQEKYDYLILFHMNACIFIGYCALVGLGTFLIMYLQCVCGMFKIARRICLQLSLHTSNNALENLGPAKGKLAECGFDLQGAKLCFGHAVYFNLMASGFGVMYLFLVTAGILFISLNLFRLVSFEFKSVLEIILTVLFTLTVIIYTLVCNWISEEVVNHNNDKTNAYVVRSNVNFFVFLFRRRYDIQWYMAPLQIQKMIVFIMLRSNKTFSVSFCGGLITGSIENAAMVLSTAISYCVVLRSIN
ncbi:uncharacterized protein [Cardiocondyla obscurior]|uniref:uncharacterized protein n=1 Tax=Cardiocondyla obscurior TaxID=286306 RepID=UPI003965663A